MEHEPQPKKEYYSDPIVIKHESLRELTGGLTMCTYGQTGPCDPV